MNRQLGALPLAALLAVAVIAVGIITGRSLIQRSQSPLSQAQVQEIRKIANRDIDVELRSPTRADIWDYILGGNLCFTSSPPSAGGKFRVELSMKLKSETNAAETVEEVIGASVSKIITNPSTLRCASATLRRADFNAPFNIPDRDRWTESCPEINIKVTSSGPWRPFPQEGIATLDRSFLCPDGVTGPQPQPQPAPITPGITFAPVPRTPITSAPAAPKITGRISVFTCVAPTSVQVTLCDKQNSARCTDVPFTAGPSTNGIWLDDSSGDRSYLYSYSISQDANGAALVPGREYVIHSANALIIGKPYVSEKESTTSIVAPGSRDLTIHAQGKTCPCQFHAVSNVYERNDNGELTRINSLDSSNLYGASNDMQIIKHQNVNNNPQYLGRPVSTFSNGKIDVAINFADQLINRDADFIYGPYGKDGLAYVRLFAADYDVVGQVCQSFGSIHACPNESFQWEKNFSTKNETNKDFHGLRVACGTDISYGWVVEKKSQSGITPPVPPPTNPGQQPPGGLVGCTPKLTDVNLKSSHEVEIEWDNNLPENCPTSYRLDIVNENNDVWCRKEFDHNANDNKTGCSVRDYLNSEVNFLHEVPYTVRLYRFDRNNSSRISAPAEDQFTRPRDSEDAPPGGGSNEDFNAFNMIVMDADAQDAQCYTAKNSGSDTIRNDNTYTHSKGQYTCSTSISDKQMNISFKNNSMRGSSDPANLNKEAIRVMWQTHRCEDDSLPCQAGGANSDRMTEAADWWCVNPGQEIKCSWDTNKWQSNPSAVSCFVDGQDVTGRRNCSYSGFTTLDGRGITIDFSKMDFNQDKVVNTADLVVCLDEYGEAGASLTCDLDNNNKVNSLDFSVMVSSQGGIVE